MSISFSIHWSTAYPCWDVRRERYADGSSAAFLCLGALRFKVSRGTS